MALTRARNNLLVLLTDEIVGNTSSWAELGKVWPTLVFDGWCGRSISVPWSMNDVEAPSFVYQAAGTFLASPDSSALVTSYFDTLQNFRWLGHSGGIAGQARPVVERFGGFSLSQFLYDAGARRDLLQLLLTPPKGFQKHILACRMIFPDSQCGLFQK